MRLYEGRPSGTVDRARELRRNAPEPERRLLRALKSAFPTLKWRHQAPVGPFFADILCFSEKLVIEVDGDTHADTASRDEGRSAFVERAGYRVVRYANDDVMRNVEGVIATVAGMLKEKGSVA